MAGLLGGMKINEKTENNSEKNYTLEGLIDVIQMKHKDVFTNFTEGICIITWMRSK